jgi:hypothetical protein
MKDEHPELPDTFSFSTILYSINVYVLSCLLVAGMVLYAGESM